MIAVAIGTARRSVRRLKPKGRNTDAQHQRGSLLDAKIALRVALLQANLADLAAWLARHEWRGVVRRDGAPMSKMRQSRSFSGEILTTP
jgi:hypothetical protein